jgi:hypothetical protein
VIPQRRQVCTGNACGSCILERLFLAASGPACAPTTNHPYTVHSFQQNVCRDSLTYLLACSLRRPLHHSIVLRLLSTSQKSRRINSMFYKVCSLCIHRTHLPHSVLPQHYIRHIGQLLCVAACLPTKTPSPDVETRLGYHRNGEYGCLPDLNVRFNAPLQVAALPEPCRSPSPLASQTRAYPRPHLSPW